MHIEFESIYLKRFRSFEKEATLHFSSAGVGLYFLKGKNDVQKALGSNGAGKSSILDGLSWCLYGKTVQGLKNPDVTPWAGKGTTIVKVQLRIDGKKHAIRRTINPNLLQLDSAETGQDYIDRLISIPQEVILYTIIMGQRKPLFFDLTASEKLKIFSEPLNLDRWEARSTHAAELVRGLENELVTKEREKALLQNQVVSIDEDIESTKAKKELWEKQRSTTIDEKDQAKSILQKKLEPLEKQRDDADLALDRAETELRALRPTLVKLQQENMKIQNELFEANNNMHSAYLKREGLLKDLEIVDEGSCPTCNQPLKSHKKAVHAEIEKQAVQLAKEFQAGARLVKRLEADLEKIETAVNAQLEAQEKFEKESDNANDSLRRLETEISSYRATIKEIDDRVAEYANQDNPFREQFADYRRRRAQIEEKIEQAEKAIEAKKEYCERVRYWIKGFKDIKLYTLEEILQELEITTNSMIEEFGLVGWSIKYDVERETKAKTIARGINIEVLSPSNSGTVKWASWSGGEAQRLRIIGSLALGSVLLNHLGVSTNLTVFDEPTESLSKEGVVDLVELLSNYANDTKKSVWMIDHHTVESNKFVDVVEVVKGKQGSRISVL